MSESRKDNRDTYTIYDESSRLGLYRLQMR